MLSGCSSSRYIRLLGLSLIPQLDYVGLSFVQNAEDIARLRRFWEARLKPGQKLPLIIAKIEKPQALENIDSIMDVWPSSAAVMLTS